MVQEICRSITEDIEVRYDRMPVAKGNSILERYFKLGAGLFILIMSYVLKVRETLVKVTMAKSDAKILDVGSGSGEQAFDFANRGYEVTAIDLTEGKLRRAVSRNKFKNLDFKVADATAMPFPDNQFDVACVSLVLHEVPAHIRLKILREMVRVTKPQGQIMIVDHALPTNKLGRYLTYKFIKTCEGSHYPDFINTNLNSDLSKLGIEVTRKISILFGSGKILKATNQKTLRISPVHDGIIDGQRDEDRETLAIDSIKC